MVVPDYAIAPPNHVSIADTYFCQYRYHFYNTESIYFVKPFV